MKRLIVSFWVFCFTFFHLKAEEGMLIPSLIQAFEDDMKAMGMKLSAEDIYSVNSSSLKDAIMHFGGGCTAELVSEQGLLLTNHHCGFSQIQQHSSLQNDYLKYGFWAKNLSEELPNPGLTASRIVLIDDVTSSVLFGTEGKNATDAYNTMQSNIKQILEDYTKNTHYKAEVKAFNYGNDYYIILNEVFTDVRLVGAPPSSIGKFGGDTDNWVWPRHTGDFSVFRVYADASNKPAVFDQNNVPYKPLHHLLVSMKKRESGQFTMVYGFPGTTEQHLSSGHLKYIMERECPAQIRMRDKSLSVIDAGMKSSDLTRIQYASKQARIANGWKKWIGQLGGLKTVDAISIKLERERLYNERANSDLEWKKRYSNVISDINNLVEKYKDKDFAYSMIIEYMYVGPELFKRGRELNKFLESYDDLKADGKLEEEIERQRKGAEAFFKDYDERIDKEIFKLLTEEFIAQLGESCPSVLKGRTSEDLANSIFSKSILTNKERFLKFLNKAGKKPGKKLKKKDPGFMLFLELDAYFNYEVIPDVRIYTSQLNDLLRIFVAGKKEMFPEDKLWPDANSTLRITYGKLEGSAPHDGMTYTEHTTVDGMIAKYNSGHSDFELLPRMLELAEKKEYGPYAQDGEMWVCFTGSNHTTGGNSGSPVLDAEGNLLGLNFDRTWESTMSDYMFDASRCRNITVDIRYVMWVMDIYAGAGHLVDEMTVIKD